MLALIPVRRILSGQFDWAGHINRPILPVKSTWYPLYKSRYLLCFKQGRTYGKETHITGTGGPGGGPAGGPGGPGPGGGGPGGPGGGPRR